MTARRRRRSGSGPSATAVIAWVGGAKIIAEHAANRAFSGQSSVASLVAERPRALSGQVRGVAMGSALAAVSVLGMTVHAGDSAPGSADAAGTPPAPVQQPPGAAPALAGPQAVRTASAAELQAPAQVHSAAAAPAAGMPLGAGPAAASGGRRAGHGAGASGTSGAAGTSVAGSPEGANSEFGAGQSQQQSGGKVEPERGPLRSALAPVGSVPRQAVDAARQALAPVTSRVSAPTVRSGAADNSAKQRLGSSVDRAAALLEDAGQPALSMLPESELGW